MLGELARRQAASGSSAPVAPSAEINTPIRKAKPPTLPGDNGSRVKRNIGLIAVIVGVVMLINYNASHLQVQSSALGGARTQQAISGRGFTQLPQGGIVTTAVAQQGENQCVSTYKTDTPTAQCQSFCSEKFKKFHCTWCKCRACLFCPKGGDAIELAAKDYPPPASPPPPADASSASDQAASDLDGDASLLSPSDASAVGSTANASTSMLPDAWMSLDSRSSSTGMNSTPGDTLLNTAITVASPVATSTAASTAADGSVTAESRLGAADAIDSAAASLPSVDLGAAASAATPTDGFATGTGSAGSAAPADAGETNMPAPTLATGSAGAKDDDESYDAELAQARGSDGDASVGTESQPDVAADSAIA